jgi:cation transport regulator ChaC
MPRKIEPYIADGIVDIPSSIINPEIMRNIRDVYDYIYKNREVNLENNDKAKKLLFILQREQKETYYPPKEYEENVNKILDKKFSKYEKNLNSEKINKVVEIILRNFIENKILQRVGEKVKVYIAHPLDDYL